eukprot:365475-Chlamydomonas_euryale.AAC.17
MPWSSLTSLRRGRAAFVPVVRDAHLRHVVPTLAGSRLAPRNPAEARCLEALPVLIEALHPSMLA